MLKKAKNRYCWQKNMKHNKPPLAGCTASLTPDDGVKLETPLNTSPPSSLCYCEVE
jgi:hypothetical protein